ncbi:hypothetical protein [Vibrio fluvialis]|uniref:hypothetical protein n=1 Tax=Vibrio fluvialis TaxID=676 RepID=UPI001EEC482D|nr:hypothetical protein [Vibrio fluvialis]MCG6391769.1 hypothetical protein [Vibrio fluvialis]
MRKTSQLTKEEIIEQVASLPLTDVNYIIRQANEIQKKQKKQIEAAQKVASRQLGRPTKEAELLNLLSQMNKHDCK